MRPHLEYASSAWSPYRKLDIKILESIQKRATKLVPSLRNLSYIERLNALGLTTLEERRKRGDLINYFKFEKGLNIINWYHPNYKTNSLRQEGPANNIRGQKHRLVRQYTGNCHQRENFFLNRVLSFWNQLSLDVIDSNSTNMFKNRYDKFIKSSKK